MRRKFQSKYKKFHAERFIWKICLDFYDHFIQTLVSLICLRILSYQPFPLYLTKLIYKIGWFVTICIWVWCQLFHRWQQIEITYIWVAMVIRCWYCAKFHVINYINLFNITHCLSNLDTSITLLMSDLWSKEDFFSILFVKVYLQCTLPLYHPLVLSNKLSKSPMCADTVNSDTVKSVTLWSVWYFYAHDSSSYFCIIKYTFINHTLWPC